MMPHTDLVTWPDPVDLPEDADLINPSAAVLNNGPASNLNRSAFLAEGGLFTSINWLAGGATAHNLKRLAYLFFTGPARAGLLEG